MSLMAEVRLDHVRHVYPGSKNAAVQDLDLVVKDGEFLVLVGPSGCGKTTILRMVAGLEEVHGGRIFIGDHDVTRLAPKERDIAMVFQNYALYPHMTVRRNIAYALRVAGLEKSEINRRVEYASKMLGLDELLNRKPAALSGGQRQRVAMGRAIVREPQVFLMDEPLSNLDAKLRVQTRMEIADLQRRLRTTTIFVTHDQVEAMTMGDRVAVLDGGVLQQVGVPKEIYALPANTFVAGFIGSPAMNLFEVPASDNGRVSLGNWSLDLATRTSTSNLEGLSTIILGVRPEDWRYSTSEDGLALEVTLVEDLGADTYVHGVAEVAPGTPASVVFRSPEQRESRKGDVLHVSPDPLKVHLFSSETRNRLANLE
jgi:multiple sugar transport system ATP-binding protein